MSRREPKKFERIERDFYRTWDPRAVPPLLRFLRPGTVFVEPCAGAGDLVDHLVRAGHRCHAAYDIEPQRGDIKRADLFKVQWRPRHGCYITNPPWTRSLLHAIIKHLAGQGPTWLLFDAGWLFNETAQQFHPYLHRVVGTPRLTWIEGTDQTSVDDTAWYYFDATVPPTPFIEFYGREA